VRGRCVLHVICHRPSPRPGRNAFDFAHPDDIHPASEEWDQRRQGVASRPEFRFLRKDGSILWAQCSATPLLDEAGRFAGAFTMVVDITDCKAKQRRGSACDHCGGWAHHPAGYLASDQSMRGICRARRAIVWVCILVSASCLPSAPRRPGHGCPESTVVLKRIVLLCALIASFLAGMMSGFSMALPGRSFWETLEEGLGPYIDEPQTKFAPTLRDEVFRSISIGSTKSQVMAALGPPLSYRYCSDETICWDYSFPYNSDASYVRRTLLFDRSGRLVDRCMALCWGIESLVNRDMGFVDTESVWLNGSLKCPEIALSAWHLLFKPIACRGCNPHV
jgi:hypothetical protein